MTIAIELIGWLGVFLLALSGLPQIIKTFRVKHVDGVSFGMVFCWFAGCFLMLIYTILDQAKLVLILNYFWSSSVNLLMLVLYLYYRYRSRRSLLRKTTKID